MQYGKYSEKVSTASTRQEISVKQCLKHTYRKLDLCKNRLFFCASKTSLQIISVHIYLSMCIILCRWLRTIAIPSKSRFLAKYPHHRPAHASGSASPTPATTTAASASASTSVDAAGSTTRIPADAVVFSPAVPATCPLTAATSPESAIRAGQRDRQRQRCR